MGDGVVISANINGEETNYTYGLERISAQTDNRKTEYVYDGRGSVAAEVSYNNAWYTFGGAFSKKDVTSKSYTPFGEPIGEAVSGFGYNGEYYNAATGMVYLRARFYEPEMNRFSQKDIVRGSVTNPSSLNRYTYVQNDPMNFIDPSGESLKSAWNSVKTGVQNAVSAVKTTVSKVTTAVKNTASKVVNTVKSAASTVANAAKSAYNSVTTAVSNVINRGTSSSTGRSYQAPASSGGSYAGSSGGGSYTSPVYSPYNSNGNATSYNNSSYQSGKAPSPDAPRIEDVTGEDVYYCNIGEYPPLSVALGSVTINMGSGWSYRIDPANTSTGTQRHIHIYHDGKEYTQNEDGSPHDQNRGSSGKLPKWVQKELMKREEWDYNGNNSSFFEQVEIRITESYTEYQFMDGKVVIEPTSVIPIIDTEKVYYAQTDTSDIMVGDGIYLPLIPNGFLPEIHISIPTLPIPAMP